MMSPVLSNILSHNEDTEIGKKWNFKSIKTIEDYRKSVPLMDYEDYRHYIERMVEKGEESLLTSDTVVYYTPTSGTTSKSKLFPQFVAPGTKIKALTAAFEQVLLLICWHQLQDESTPLGVPIIPALNAEIGAVIDSDPSQFVAPPEAYQITDFASAMYVQMVFGLKTSTVKCIFTGFCPTALTAFNLLAQEWEQMVEAIRSGTLKPSLNLAESQRNILEEALGGGDPRRANELVEILSDSAMLSDFKSIAHQLWPNLALVVATAGGPFATYVPQLQRYLGDKISISSPAYGASEGVFGINKWLGSCVSAYSLQTNEFFFEFVPWCNANSSQPSTLLAEDIKVGEVYEIVVTTSGGLYRYRMGDLIKVLEEGSASDPPVIDVLGRKNLELSICGEKVTEYQLADAISAATGQSGPWNQCSIQGYILTANTKSIPPIHQLWIEFSAGVHTSSDDVRAILAEGAAYVDKKLAEMNMIYANVRARSMIGPMVVWEVNTGTFVTLISTLKKRSHVSETQLKVPQVTADPQLIEILESAKFDTLQ